MLPLVDPKAPPFRCVLREITQSVGSPDSALVRYSGVNTFRVLNAPTLDRASSAPSDWQELCSFITSTTSREEASSMKSAGSVSLNDSAPVLERARIVSQPQHSSRPKLWFGSAAAILLMASAVLLRRYYGAEQVLLFQTAAVERGDIESAVSATGSCNAVVTVDVGSQVSGNIKALYADFNTRVKSGQLVALIDPDSFEARVQQARASWESSKANVANVQANVKKTEADIYNAHAVELSQEAAVTKAAAAVIDAQAKRARRIELNRQGIIAREDLDTAQATYDEAVAEQKAAEAQREAAKRSVEAAEASHQAALMQVSMAEAQVNQNLAALNQASIELAHTRILAPVDGTVIARRMDVGQTVAASFQAPTIFQIAQDLTKMQVDTNVDEADVGRLRVSQPAAFTVDSYPTTVFHGTVTQIRQAPINVQNVITYDAVVEVSNPDLKLFPGMTANVRIVTDRKAQALKLPNAALRFRAEASAIGGGNAVPPGWRIVFMTENGKARAVPVKTGISDGNFTTIEEGAVQEGEQVITGNASKGATPAATPSPSLPRRTGF
jgi:HlyD family secretion protein